MGKLGDMLGQSEAVKAAMTPSPAPAPTEALTDEWMRDMMFDHLAIIACEPDKWKRIDLFAKFGHQVKATVEKARTPAAGVDRERLARWLNEFLNKRFNLYMVGKDEAFEVADALLSSGILGESAQAADIGPAGAPAWQPIDSAPKDGTRIDIWSPDPILERCPNSFWNKRRGVWETHTGLRLADAGCAPTHWMLPPAPPQSEPALAAPNALEKVSTDV